MVYPVGSIYIGTTNANPSTFIGGEWEAYGEGRTLVGAGTGTDVNSVERTFGANDVGGEYEHTLTVQEMPSHYHGAYAYSSTTGNGDTALANTQFNYVGLFTKWGGTAERYYHSNVMESTGNRAGGSQPHNNIQPYIVTYMWKRIN